MPFPGRLISASLATTAPTCEAAPTRTAPVGSITATRAPSGESVGSVAAPSTTLVAMPTGWSFCDWMKMVETALEPGRYSR